MTKAFISDDERDKMIPEVPLTLTVLAEEKSWVDSVTMEPTGPNCGEIENVAPLPLLPDGLAGCSTCYFL
jgi:hypothetical protein